MVRQMMPGPSKETETDVVRHRYDRGAARYDWVTWPMEKMAMDRSAAGSLGR